MPSIVSHPAVPLAPATVLPAEVIFPSVVWLGIACSTIPDLDVVGFRVGVPRGQVLGQRGLSHSIVFAVCLSERLVWLLSSQSQPLKASSLTVFLFLLLSTLSHGLLDAMTTGGSGVAFFAPIHNQRYFLPWRLIVVVLAILHLRCNGFLELSPGMGRLKRSAFFSWWSPLQQLG
jgi:inner membrane protein